MTFSHHPNRLLWLIITCLLLLGLSQVLWIKRVWNEQKDILQQESNFLFQQTVMTLQDSLVRRSMTRNGIPLEPELRRTDSIFQRRIMHFAPQRRTGAKIQLDEAFMKENFPQDKKEAAQVKIIVSASDSQTFIPQRGLGRFLLNVHVDSLSQGSSDFVFNIESDSLSPEELSRSYSKALKQAALPEHFNLLSGDNPMSLNSTTAVSTDPAPAGLLQQRFFLAEFKDYQGYLFKKIVPYGLFSLFLFGLISLAFWLIFNTLKQQRRLAEQKNEFISNVSHELKTPLTTVGVALEALHDFEVLRNPEKTREYLQISKLELDRLNLLVDKVLRLSMFEQQALKLHPETLDLTATVQQVISAMTLQAKGVGAVIHFSLPKQPCWVDCDRLHLSGVVYNLLDNALKYRHGTPEIEVSIGSKYHDGQEFVTLNVRDNGIGIASEFQTQIFEKFFRVPSGDTHNVKGHGLGLSYVAHVAREHGGSIRVESQLGKGSTFTMEIPAAMPPLTV